MKEREYLVKQIKFLQDINFDQKTKELQSFREKYLEEEVSKLRDYVKRNKTVKQHSLE